MPEIEFLKKLMQKIEKVDRASLQTYLQHLNDEKDLAREILDSLEEGFIAVDEKLRVKLLSRGAKSLLGISHASSCEQKPLQDLLQDSQLKSFLVEGIRSGLRVYQQEIEVLTPAHAYVSVSIAPLKKPLEPDHFAILLANMTFPREREREFLQLEKIETLISLAAGIAHEIGNPLNSIGIHLRILAKELESVPAEKKKRCLETLGIISAETKRLDDMVRNFLKVTRKKPVSLREEDIHALLKEALKILEPEIKKAGVKIHLDLAKNLSSFLLDAEKIHQVFINLIKNAIQSMPDGGSLYVKTSRKDKICTISFRDEGSGIADEDLPKIFDAYFTTKEEGSGLGLMIVSGIVRDHGGRIEVRSKLGEGSVFAVHLPIRGEKRQIESPL